MRFTAPVLATILLASLLPLPPGAAPAEAQDLANDVPYVPTPPAVVQAMLEVADVGPDDVVLDLGSGDGRIVIAAARDFGARGTGVEIDATLVEQARENARNAGVDDRVTFLRKDLFETDLREATVVALYLLPMVNLRLRPKLLRELRPGTRVVAHAFDMDTWEPDREFEVEGRRVLFWKVPAPVEGAWEWKSPTDSGHDVEVVLDQEFQRLWGAVRTPEDRFITLEDGAVDGERVSFTLVDHDADEPVRMKFEGTAGRERITGTVEVQGGPAAGIHPWAALRSRPEPSLRPPGS